MKTIFPYTEVIEKEICHRPEKVFWVGLLSVEGLWLLSHEDQSVIQKALSDRLKMLCPYVTDVYFRIQHYDFIFFIQEEKNETLSFYERWNEDLPKILHGFRQSFLVNGIAHHFIPRFGFSTSCFDNFSIQDWILRAQISVQKAKENPNCTYFFQEKDKILRQEEFYLRSDLCQAINQNEFEVYYQPKINIETNTCVGVEALARWSRPNFGMVSPTVFIPALEKNHLIEDFSKIVLDKICKDIDKIQQIYQVKIPVSFNLSMNQIDTEIKCRYFEGMMADVQRRYSEIQFDVELTENLLVNDFKKCSQLIKNLKTMGITCSLDDFGTGFSSLNYLQYLSADILKIDKSFIDNLGSSKAYILVESIINLAHKLDFRVVAEGVETQEQWELLKQLKCDDIQGYYISPPLRIQEFSQWLK